MKMGERRRKAVKLWLIVGVWVIFPVYGGAADPAVEGEQALAEHLMDVGGMWRGLCSVLGSADAGLALEIARSDRFYVHVLDDDPAAVASSRKMVDVDGLYGKRIVVERSAFDSLPYADNIVDLIVATRLSKADLSDLSIREILRVLRPRGKAILGSRRDFQVQGEPVRYRELRRWLRSEKVEEYDIKRDRHGTWAFITKPVPEGADRWSHWEHGPDNNPVSTDTVIRAPYMTQWLGLPYYIAMPAITTAAGGRIFIAMGHIAHHKREEPWLNTLLARNGYNGTILWSRKLPDGYLVHRSAFVATDNAFYMIDDDGNGCLVLDPETGYEIEQITLPELRGDWKWMVLEDNVLYVLMGEEKDPAETTVVRSEYTHWSWGELSKGYYQKRVPWGFGRTIFAYHMRRRRLLWTHTEEVPVDSRAMAVGGGRLFFYGPDSHIGCLDAKTGRPIWTNDDPRIRQLIEEPGRGLASTPGFRTSCYCLYTPKALFYQAQTRMNLVAVSTEDGRLLWHRRKTTNNPNMLYVDDRLVVGIGKDGNTLVLDPLTGETIKDLGFKKRSCARLTATPDSFFCRGWPEGLTRYDRNSGKVLFNGAFRPSCNDGVVPANGLLYLGPWACDCNLSLMGRVALCSAGDFQWDRKATEPENLEIVGGDISREAVFDISPQDWTTYRGNNARSARTLASVPAEVSKIWEFQPETENLPSPLTSAGGLIFAGGSDGKVRAIDASTGSLKWTFPTAGPIMQPPTLWNGRAYVGSGDGYIYVLEAATGRLLWRFRAAPVERRIMVYGSLCSTWPVNSGVLVEDGVAYAAAGTIDYDGTYVYALDAVTGRIKWQNTTSGHLDEELRKGVSAQGVLTVAHGRLWMSGGNVVSPAVYDLQTGEYLGDPPGDGSPRANRGVEIGVLNQNHIVLGGKLRYSASENVVDPGTFVAVRIKPEGGVEGAKRLNNGRIPPAWDAERIIFVNGRRTPPACYSVAAVEKYLEQIDAKKPPETVWTASEWEEIDTVSIVLAENAVVTVAEMPRFRNLRPRWVVCALNPDDGSKIWQQDLPAEALPDTLMVDRDGRVVVGMRDGRIACFGGTQAVAAYIDAARETAKKGAAGRRKAVRLLTEALRSTHNPLLHDQLVAALEELGVRPDETAKKKAV